LLFVPSETNALTHTLRLRAVARAKLAVLKIFFFILFCPFVDTHCSAVNALFMNTPTTAKKMPFRRNEKAFYPLYCLHSDKADRHLHRPRQK